MAQNDDRVGQSGFELIVNSSLNIIYKGKTKSLKKKKNKKNGQNRAKSPDQTQTNIITSGAWTINI